MTTPVSLGHTTGEVLDGRYRLVDRIGEGGMARVYRAEDLHLERTVAVKIMRGPASELGSIERARSETTLLASLNHHALVTLYDAELSSDNVTYLVMEHVDGITLRDLIARGPVDPATTAKLAAELAEALHVAHSAGVVHRDIKPSNVLLSPSPVPGAPWRPKLADFGIAYLLDSPRVTTPGLMVGTIAYLAPEQADGAAPAPPADVYSLGIMLIEALSGARPFPHAEGIGALLARMSTPPPIPESLPEQWRQLLRGMTAQRPDDRPTALEVATTASQLAGRTDAAAAVSVPVIDVTTAAVAAPLLSETIAGSRNLPEPTRASRSPAPESPTERTAVLPPLPPAPPLATDVAPPEPGAPRAQAATGPRRVSLVAVVLVGALLAAAAVLFGVWSSASATGPERAVTRTQAPAPTTAPTTAPAEDTESTSADEPADTSAPADTTSGTGGSPAGGGSGGSNPNSGPGNNNGGGNGNGKGGGNGNGNG
ncbi:protein kinase [Microbacter sp. GSS18]|nr:protein kinase [Microbacter sp. GSS18]